MGQVRVDIFSTLDGVAQAPGGPQEDTAGGFRFGGWQAPLLDEVGGQWVGANMAGLDALLLGRRTYEIFAGYWPTAADGPDGGIAELFNRVPKYVASRNAGLELGWANSQRIGADLPAEIDDLRARHESVHVIGSLDLFQTLLAQRLFDVLTLWIHPVVLGQGKRVFDPGDTAARMRLLEPALTSPTGIVQLRYGPLPGAPGTGDMSQR